MSGFSVFSPHYLFTPTLTLPLKGEGIYEGEGIRESAQVSPGTGA